MRRARLARRFYTLVHIFVLYFVPNVRCADGDDDDAADAAAAATAAADDDADDAALDAAGWR